MPRKPNYDFERRERDKARALKKAERQRLKKEKADLRKEGATDAPADASTGDSTGLEPDGEESDAQDLATQRLSARGAATDS